MAYQPPTERQIRESTRWCYRTPFFVYALCEPETGEVRYIGRTAYPESRIGQHACKRNAVGEWIRGLRASGQEPTLNVLARIVGLDKAHQRERIEIADHAERLGSRLLNRSSRIRQPRDRNAARKLSKGRF